MTFFIYRDLLVIDDTYVAGRRFELGYASNDFPVDFQLALQDRFSDANETCYKYVCSYREGSLDFHPNKLFYWNRLFDVTKCCQHNTLGIPIGKSVRTKNPSNLPMLGLNDIQCSEQIVYCSPDHVIEIYNQPNAKCCSHENEIIQFGETIYNAEVKSYN